MKNIWLFLMVLVMVAFLAGCKGHGPDPSGESSNTSSENTTSGEETSQMTSEEMEAMVQPRADLVVEIGETTFYAELEDNDSAKEFFEKLKEGPLTLELHDYGGFEKVGDLPWTLTRCDESITTEPGDIILYLGNQITIYYDENTWTFTRLGKIENVTTQTLLDAMGDGSVTVTFWLEWSE